MIPIDIKGQVFGRITVLSYDKTSRKTGHAKWICKCSCGKKLSIRASHLKEGTTKSCGCYAIEKSTIFLTKYANSKKHKGSGNPAWKGEKAGIGSIHGWLARHYKKGKFCQHCKLKKKLDWALKKGCKYEHDRKNFIPLCRSCHLKYDYTPERREKMKQHLSVLLKKRHGLL